MIIQKAVRERTYTLTSISGPSGSGKSYSALLYARGLVGPDGKIGFIDTENKRSRFYANVGGGFDVIDLDPPFTPGRYLEAIQAFEDAGYKAIVVDSISHEWEGTGGILEQAEEIERRSGKEGLHCWNKPKKGHKKLSNKLLQTQAHLIFCCRVKEKVKQVKNGGRTEIINDGYVAIQEKNFIYEMTLSMVLSEGSHIPTLQKCPDDLLQAFPDGKRITTANGEAVGRWATEGAEVDSEVAALRLEAMEQANKGFAAMSQWWRALGGPKQRLLAPLQATLKSIAAARDEMNADAAEHDRPDFAKRMQDAPRPSEQGEGFDREFVRESVARINGSAAASNGDLFGSASSQDAAEGGEGDGKASKPAAPSPALDVDPVLRALKVECRDKFLALASDKSLAVEDRRKSLEIAKEAWKSELASEHHEWLKRVVGWADAVAKTGDAQARKALQEAV